MNPPPAINPMNSYNMPGSRPAIGLLALISVVIAVLAQASSEKVQSDSEDPDARVLAQLKRAGSNLSKPHPLEFFLYFPTEDAARKASTDIQKQGFAVTVTQAAKGPDWLCLAKKSMVPGLSALHRIRAAFAVVTAAHKGDYDGWGTPVVK